MPDTLQTAPLLDDGEFVALYRRLLAAARRNFLAFLHILHPQGEHPTYMIGRMHEHLARRLQAVMDGAASPRQTISVPPQHGKQLADDTPVLTGSGWSTHGELRPGDRVFHPSGALVEVVAESARSMSTVEVEFSTGERICCHERHEWLLYKDKRAARIVEAGKLLTERLWRGKRGRRGSRAMWQLPSVSPLDGPEVCLPVDPYFLGYWLGNGKQTQPMLTVSGPDTPLVHGLAYSPSGSWSNGKENDSRNWYFGGHGLRSLLRGLGLGESKFVPGPYACASRRQRLELLAGLIDSDGSLHASTGQYRFSNTNPRLVEDVVSLVRSFGWTCSASWTPPCPGGTGIAGRLPVCQIGFTPSEPLPCRVPRKQSTRLARPRKVSVVAVRRVEGRPGKCIEVDSPDGLYLAGRTLLPTHNSRLASVRFVAWLLGRYPGIHVVMTGFSYTLLTDFVREIKQVVGSDTYRRVFGDLDPLYGRDRMDSVHFTNGSSLIARSAGSKLAGRRADVLIIDDPHAGRAEAESPLQRRRVLEWYFGDCMTRLSNNAKVFVIATRWHPRDLIGHLTSPDYMAALEAEGQGDQRYESTVMRAIADGSGTDPLGRAEGEPLFPEQRPLSFLLKQRAELGAFEWSSQYDQNPRPEGMGQADTSKLRYCLPADVPEGLAWTRGWDLALTEKQQADFTAGARCAMCDGTLYIGDVFRRQWAWSKVRAQIIAQAYIDKEAHGALRIAVEGVSGFDAVYEDVKRELAGEVKVTKRNPPKGGKLLRAQPWLNLLEAGRVVLVRGPWNKDFVEELETFPGGRNDDQIDAVSIAHEELTKPAPKLLLA